MYEIYWILGDFRTVESMWMCCLSMAGNSHLYNPANGPTLAGYWRQRADERFGGPPPRWIQEPFVVRDRDGRPPHRSSALWQCAASVCVAGVRVGDIFGVSRSRERDLLYVLLICPNILSCLFIVCCHVVFCYMLMSVGCLGLVVSTCPPPAPFPFGRICFVVLVMRKRGRAVEVVPDI